MPVETAVKPSLTLKRRLKASPAKVFAAWTDPEKIKRWMGPGEIVTVRAESDPREGGRYRDPDALAERRTAPCRRGLSRGHRQRETGVHLGLAIRRPERESLVTVLLKPDGEGTLLTLDA